VSEKANLSEVQTSTFFNASAISDQPLHQELLRDERCMNKREGRIKGSNSGLSKLMERADNGAVREVQLAKLVYIYAIVHDNSDPETCF
jgi:hypothetical protein